MVRTGWVKAILVMAARGDDRLLDPPRPTRWDEEEWYWWVERALAPREESAKRSKSK